MNNPKMSSGDIKTKDELAHGDHVDVELSEKSDILDGPDILNDAFDGENREHDEGLWESAKSHPWACLWAFIMCFTIVSIIPLLGFIPGFRVLNRVNSHLQRTKADAC